MMTNYSLLSTHMCYTRTTDTQWRHKSKISENLGWCGRHNMLRPYLKIWEWEWIFGRAVKAISSLGVHSPWLQPYLCCWVVLHIHVHTNYLPYLVCSVIHNHKQHQFIPQWVDIISEKKTSYFVYSINMVFSNSQ